MSSAIWTEAAREIGQRAAPWRDEGGGLFEVLAAAQRHSRACARASSGGVWRRANRWRSGTSGRRRRSFAHDRRARPAPRRRGRTALVISLTKRASRSALSGPAGKFGGGDVDDQAAAAASDRANRSRAPPPHQPAGGARRVRIAFHGLGEAFGVST